MSALVAPTDLNLDQFTQQLHTQLAWSGSMAEPKVYTITVETPVIPADSEDEARDWHTQAIAEWTDRQADQWSDGILVYRYANRTDGEHCIVTWPVTE